MSGSLDLACCYVAECLKAASKLASSSSWSKEATLCSKVSYCWLVLCSGSPSVSFCIDWRRRTVLILLLSSFCTGASSLRDVKGYTCWIDSRGHLTKSQGLEHLASLVSRLTVIDYCHDIRAKVTSQELQSQSCSWKITFIKTCSTLFLNFKLAKLGQLHLDDASYC